jgi:hypothetical protein
MAGFFQQQKGQSSLLIPDRWIVILRSELCGILSLLFIISHICHYYHITTVKINIYCDNKSALQHTFNKHHGPPKFLSTDYDLINLTHNILGTFALTISSEWVKGHYSGSSITMLAWHLSLILVPRLRPCSGRLKGKAMICLLSDSVRIKARAETDSGRFTKRYFYMVLSRVYNFYKL